MTEKELNIIFDEGLEEYEYYDMDVVIVTPLEICKREFI